MADGDAGYITTTTGAVFVPEIWQQEIIKALYGAFHMRNVFREVPIPRGTDTLHFGEMKKLVAEQITEGTPLTGKQNTETQKDLVINQNWGVPITISKRLAIQAQNNINLLSEYMERAGQALAYKLETDLMALYSGFSQTVDCYSTGSTYGDLTAAYILQARKKLNDAHAPMTDRYLIVSTQQESKLLDLDRFVDVSKYGSNRPIMDGELGMIYGFRCLVSPYIVATGGEEMNLAVHKDAAHFGIQDISMDPWEYHTLKQGWDGVASMLYGVAEKRDAFAVVLKTDEP